MAVTITCSKCKAEKKTNYYALKKLTDKAGSEEQLKKTYLCRACRPKKTAQKVKKAPAEE